MTDAGGDDPRAAIRRKNRELRDDDWIRAALHTAPVGVLATAAGSQPFVNSNLFVFDEAARAIYLHTAGTGRTRATLEANPSAAFTVFDMGRLVPAPRAVDFTAEYASVVVFGRVRLVQDPARKHAVLDLWFAKYWPELVPGRDFAGVGETDVARTMVAVLGIESWSAKRNRQPADAPGARRYHRPPLMDLETPPGRP